MRNVGFAVAETLHVPSLRGLCGPDREDLRRSSPDGAAVIHSALRNHTVALGLSL